MTGYVYFVQGIDGGPFKIGFSLTPSRRLTQLQNASPVRLRLLGVIVADSDFEKVLHARLAPFRMHGEWFADAPEVREVVAEHVGRVTAHDLELRLAGAISAIGLRLGEVERHLLAGDKTAALAVLEAAEREWRDTVEELARVGA